MERDYYNPSYGESIMPVGLLPAESIPNGANKEIEMMIEPETKILYWANEPIQAPKVEGSERMPWEIYSKSNYTNGGTATSNKEGIIKIMIRGNKNGCDLYYRKVMNGLLGRINKYSV